MCAPVTFLPALAAAEAKAVLGDRRSPLGLLGEGGAVHADRFALRLPGHAQDGGDKLRVPRREDPAHLAGRPAPVVADVGDNAAPDGPLAPVFLQGRFAVRQASVAAGEAGVGSCQP